MGHLSVDIPVSWACISSAVTERRVVLTPAVCYEQCTLCTCLQDRYCVDAGFLVSYSGHAIMCEKLVYPNPKSHFYLKYSLEKKKNSNKGMSHFKARNIVIKECFVSADCCQIDVVFIFNFFFVLGVGFFHIEQIKIIRRKVWLNCSSGY